MKRPQAAALTTPSNRAILLLAIVALITSSTCSFGKDKSIAEGSVAQFHKQFNARQFREIYNKSAEQMKNAATESQFVSLLEGTRRKLGSVEGSRQQRWNVNTTTNGTFATLVYNTDFSEGKGTESFVFSIGSDEAKLVGYHVESPLFATK